MTARTHDLFAFTAMVAAVVLVPVTNIAFGTAVVAFGAGFLGGMAPDLDEPGAQFWRRLPAGSGSIFGRIVAPVFGSHRFVSHSIIGMWWWGWLMTKILESASGFLIVDRDVVWSAFMLGVGSHLVADALTREGVPLLWPLPIKFGFPPFKALRMVTGGWMEKATFVLAVGLNAYLIYSNQQIFVDLVKGLV